MTKEDRRFWLLVIFFLAAPILAAVLGISYTPPDPSLLEAPGEEAPVVTETDNIPR